jgi:hypothetical protein
VVAGVAADWSQFRGPGGTGIAPAADPPLSWDDAKSLRWKTPLPGPGSSSPIIVGDRIFLTYYTGYGGESKSDKPSDLKRHLLCVNRSDGSTLWTASENGVDEEDPYRGFITEHGYASSTPVSDGERVYAFFGKSGVAAYDLAGKRLWHAEVGGESDPRGWGSAASPIVYKNLLIVNASSEGRAIRAFDKITGKPVWKSEARKLALAFGTPAVIKSPVGRDELVVPVPGEVWGLNPINGKLLWWATVRIGGNVSPSVVAGDGIAYVTGGFPEKGTVAIRAGGSDDVTNSHVAWSIKEGSYVPTPVLTDGRLHWVNELGLAVCVDAATGKMIYTERLPLKGNRGGKPVYASAVLAGGRIYAVTRTAGTYVLAPGAEFKQLAHNALTDDSDFNATPAVEGRQLFLRSNKYLYCFESEEKGASR